MIGIGEPWGALGLVAVAALVALHLWDRRRRVVPVSSLLLWRRLPAAPLERRRRLRPDLLFWLALACVLALVGALVRPWVGQADAPVGAVAQVLVLDVSASMQTREPGGTRFAMARRRAAALAADASETLLIAAALRPRVVVSWTRDTALVRARLEALEPLDVAGDLAPALGLALAHARSRPGARIAVLTDVPRRESGLGDDELAWIDWITIGQTADNVALTGLAVEAPPFRPAAEASVAVTVRNYAPWPRQMALRARAGGISWDHRLLALDPRAGTTVRLERPPAPGPIEVALEGGDALAADDVAFGWIPEAPTLDVVVVSDDGRLGRALAEIAGAVPGARITMVRAAEDVTRQGGTGARITVFDGSGPAATARGRVLVVGPEPGDAVCPTSARVDAAAVVDWEPGHGLVAGLAGLESLVVETASALEVVPWGTVVAHAAAADRTFPFLVAGVRDGRRTACLAAAPKRPSASTDELPLVVLLLATLRWLADGTGPEPVVVRTGVPAEAPPGARADADGLRIAGDPPALVAERTGAYRVRVGETETLVLASLLDARESDVGRDGPIEIPATARGAPPRGARSGRDLGWWLVLAALALLATEWGAWRVRHP
jgi:hypothetical protein